MKSPTFNDGQFDSAAALNQAFAALASGVAQTTEAMHTPGLVNPSQLFLAESGLVVDVAADSPTGFAIVFGSGVIAQGLGTTPGAPSIFSTVNMAPLVPSSGSVTAYIVATTTQVQEQAQAIIGPPQGHPDYDPTFAPYTGYTEFDDTLVFTGTLTPPDNEVYIEICRMTLVAGETTISSVDTSHQVIAGSVLAPGQAAVNVGTLGGCLTGTLPNPGLSVAAVAALIPAVFGVPGSISVPTTAGTLIIQWGYALLNNGGSLQTTIQSPLATTWPNGFILGFCEDSALEPSFSYTCSAGADTSHVNIRCAEYYVTPTGTIISRSTITGQTRGVWIAFGY